MNKEKWIGYIMRGKVILTTLLTVQWRGKEKRLNLAHDPKRRG